MRRVLPAAITLLTLIPAVASAQVSTYYDVQKGDFPHAVAAGVSGEVWYASRRRGPADPATGQIERIALGENSASQGSSLGRTARRGLPMADRTRSFVLIGDRRGEHLAAPARAHADRVSQYCHLRWERSPHAYAVWVGPRTTRSGFPNGPPMRSCALIRQPRHSAAFQ